MLLCIMLSLFDQLIYQLVYLFLPMLARSGSGILGDNILNHMM